MSKLNGLKNDFRKGYQKVSDTEADTQKVRKLEAENKRLLKLIESEHFSYPTTTGKKYSVFNTVRKQFAEELKEKSYVDNDCTEVVEVKKIDELLEEYLNNEH